MSVLASDGVQQRSQADSVSIGVHMKKPLPGVAQPVNSYHDNLESIQVDHDDMLSSKLDTYRMYSSATRAR